MMAELGAALTVAAGRRAVSAGRRRQDPAGAGVRLPAPGDYDLVWWIRAEEPATPLADYAASPAALGLPQARREQAPAIAAGRRRWRAGPLAARLRQRREPDDVAPCCRERRGRVLITSRATVWGGLAEQLEVKVAGPG